MNIKDVLKGVQVVKAAGAAPDAVDISSLACDSRDAAAGALFVAVRGAQQDGHLYIADALQRGAAAVVFQDAAFFPKQGVCVPFIQARDSKVALARAAGNFFGEPYRHIRCVGITGTNGKTTTSYLVRSILNAAGLKCALIGTIGYRIDDTNVPSQNTTPGILELHQLLRRMIDSGNQYVAMEVSSHALDQDRVEGMVFRAALFTNLTQDHLDYHKDMEAYFRAKEKLFFEHVESDSHLIVNTDDPFGRRLYDSLKGHRVGYGFVDTDVSVVSHRISRDATQATIKTPKGSLEISSGLVGRYNLYNILAAVAFAVSEGLGLDIVREGIERVPCVPGRLERIDAPQGFSVFVDYAHTDDALKNVLESLRSIIHNGRIVTVFGCGGDRDRGKRPKMGRVASALSDHCIITSDNPRSEDPHAIIAEIASGFIEQNYEIEPDREAAIRRALAWAKPGDFVLLAGKGHETYQVIKDNILDFDDKSVVVEALRGLKKHV